GRVAHEREEIADPLGPDAELGLDLGGTEALDLAAARAMPAREWVVDLHAIGHELREILVSGYDPDLAAFHFALLREGADHVVRLEARDREHGEPEPRDDPVDRL